MNASPRITAVLSIVTLLLAACAPSAVPPGSSTYTDQPGFAPEQDVQASQFSSSEQLAAFLRASQSEGDSYYALGGAKRSFATAAMDSVAESAPAVAGSSAGAPDFSETNNQVASVDEADIIKTDGNYIYTISGSTVFIVSAGADATVVSQIDLEEQPAGLFIDGDKMLVFGSFYDQEYLKKHDLKLYTSLTFAKLYDVSDRKKPREEESFVFEGNYFQARLKDGFAYLIVTSTPDWHYPIPLIMRGEDRIAMPVSDIYYWPVPYSDVQYATIHAIDLADESLASKTLAVEGANTVYMSENNIYIASTEYINEWELRQDILNDVVEPKLSEAEKRLIQKIKQADDEVLSPAEKKSKIQQVYTEYVSYLSNDEQEEIQDTIEEKLADKLEEYDAFEYTVITRVSYDRDDLSVEGTGQVPGHLNNQFSLDEHNDVLRLATTEGQRFWGGIRSLAMADVAVAGPAPVAAESEAEKTETSGAFDSNGKLLPPLERTTSINNVFTLNMDLEILDSVRGIAPSESIQSARFIADRLYLVTYRQVDPFFVFDLSDAKNIKELGKLKVPGFSRYLHPFSEDVIIGIGRDATTTGRQEGLKISLFDVSDPSNPKELAKWVASDDYSQSTAEWEHKAFLFDREKELLVIPGYSYDYNYRGTTKERYNGAMVFRITADEIELRGIVDHSKGSTQQYWGPLVERSLWIDDMLYTKSPSLVRINELEDLSSVKDVTLSGKNASPYPIY